MLIIRESNQERPPKQAKAVARPHPFPGALDGPSMGKGWINISPASSNTLMIDPDAPKYSQRFYRAVRW